ncbi:hypothetical protein M9458_008745, partial [Cirrhinus mrigala]
KFGSFITIPTIFINKIQINFIISSIFILTIADLSKIIINNLSKIIINNLSKIIINNLTV